MKRIMYGWANAVDIYIYIYSLRSLGLIFLTTLKEQDFHISHCRRIIPSQGVKHGKTELRTIGYLLFQTS